MAFGVEPVCRTLSEQGIKIAPSTYYEARSRRPSKQQILRELILDPNRPYQPSGRPRRGLRKTSNGPG